jgi:hypothetical protein
MRLVVVVMWFSFGEESHRALVDRLLTTDASHSAQTAQQEYFEDCSIFRTPSMERTQGTSLRNPIRGLVLPRFFWSH